MRRWWVIAGVGCIMIGCSVGMRGTAITDGRTETPNYGSWIEFERHFAMLDSEHSQERDSSEKWLIESVVTLGEPAKLKLELLRPRGSTEQCERADRVLESYLDYQQLYQCARTFRRLHAILQVTRTVVVRNEGDRQGRQFGWLFTRFPEIGSLLTLSLSAREISRTAVVEGVEIRFSLEEVVLELDPIELVSLAHICLSVGDIHSALRHFRNSGLSYSASRRSHHKDGLQGDPNVLVCQQITRTLRGIALDCANRGKPTGLLLELWQCIGDLASSGALKDEALRMISAYRFQANESPQGERQPTDLPRVQGEIAFWIERLVSLDVVQKSSPGSCDVLASWASRSGLMENPALRLLEVGREAMPLLIEHLDDTRPTRCLAWQGKSEPENLYLLRVGDCCYQILKAMVGTELDFLGDALGYPCKEGDPTHIKRRIKEALLPDDK